MQSTKVKPHICLLASPGMGHLIPVVELGKRLVAHHDVQVTVFVVASHDDASNSNVHAVPNNNNLFNVVTLPLANISGLVNPDASLGEKILVLMHKSLPALRSAISAMKFRPTALIVDFFGTEAMDVADEFGLLKYMFIASNAWFLACFIHAPAIDKKLLTDEHFNLEKPMELPGCMPVRFQDSLELFLHPNEPIFDFISSIGMKMSLSDGILVNTWDDLEPKTLGSLRDDNLLGRVCKAPVYAIGPLVRSPDVASPSTKTSPSDSRVIILDWLNEQPSQSVIYVSFGSGGTLSAKQMTELAWGLELSQQRFIWVVRPPVENDVSGSYLTVVDNNSAGKLEDYLPHGFLTRTDKVGLVVPEWAPQAEILAHPSVGGFLSHCGWNSTVESIVNGVPMIAWPLYAEQKMNATMLTEEIGVAFRSKELPTESLVTRQEIEMLVRKIMVDKEGHSSIRVRAMELKYGAQKATSNSGSSYKSLSQVAKQCEKSLQELVTLGQGA